MTKSLIGALLLAALTLVAPASAVTVTAPAGDAPAYVYGRAEWEHHYSYSCYVIDGEVWLENGRAPGLQRYGPNADREVVGDRFHDMCFV